MVLMVLRLPILVAVGNNQGRMTFVVGTTGFLMLDNTAIFCEASITLISVNCAVNQSKSDLHLSHRAVSCLSHLM